MSEQENKGGDEGSKYTPPASQEEFNRIIAERVERERKKFADYDDLKAKAGRLDQAEQEAKTAEQKVNDRISALESELTKSQAEATRARIQAKHSISDDDAELFLTATDADGLEKQAKALADRLADRKKKGPVVPSQKTDTPDPKTDPLREVARQVFRTNT